MISTVVAFPTVLWLSVRVLIDSGAHQKAGPWLELLVGLGVLLGSFVALRQEGIRAADGPGEVRVVELAAPRTSEPRRS